MKNSWWPSVGTESGAKDAARQGAGAAIFVAAVTALFSVLALFGFQIFAGFSAYALVDAAIFGFVAWRIFRMSRAWAVVGLVGFIAERVYIIAVSGANGTAGLVVGILILIAFINGVRGTFAYHNLSKVPGVVQTAS